MRCRKPGVAVLPLIENVVDSDYGHGARKDLMFLGGYNHPPNVDAASYLLDEVWPRLSRDLPDARLLLVGANPPQSLKDRASDRVLVTGRVDDLAPWFGRTRVFLAALRYGAGAKGKVLAAMAHGVPVVAHGYRRRRPGAGGWRFRLHRQHAWRDRRGRHTLYGRRA
ncbi:MAG: glycosyltransferase family 4 protein [Asticcacaulis sp.]